MRVSCLFRTTLGLALVALASSTARADFLAPSAPVDGQSQSVLSQAWWQWALSFPVDKNPLLDHSGTFSAEGSQGNVFFLGGFIGQNNQGVQGKAERWVTVSPTQTIFFPVLNVIGSTSDANNSTGGPVANNIPTADLAKYVADGLSSPQNMHVTLSQVGSNQTQSLDQHQLLTYQQTTGIFNATMPPNNIYYTNSPGTYPVLSTGYWVALAPLPVGHYDLTFGGDATQVLPNAYGFTGGSFAIHEDITYHITSKTPEPATWLLAAFGGLPLLYRLRFRGKAWPANDVPSAALS